MRGITLQLVDGSEIDVELPKDVNGWLILAALRSRKRGDEPEGLTPAEVACLLDIEARLEAATLKAEQAADIKEETKLVAVN